MREQVAIQGERGAFSESAARSLLGNEIAVLPCPTFDDAFAAVLEGRALAAVVPIENSLAGSVVRTYELLGSAHLQIVAETQLRIRLSILGHPGTRLDQVRRVLSHPVALAQCQRFLAMHPGLEAIAAYDTAGAVKLVMAGGNRGEAAIAAAEAAGIYGAEVIEENVEDHSENFTRFFVITRPENASAFGRRVSTGPLKTTVLFRTPNTPGALFRALAAFALRDINLTKLESRPIHGRPWEYAFYADIAGGADEPAIRNALAHLREMCEVTLLGSYAAEAGDGNLPA